MMRCPPREVLLAFCLLCSRSIAADAWAPHETVIRDAEGAIIRGDVHQRRLALIFTGDVHAESSLPLLDALKARGIKAAFFVTGNFLRNPELRPAIRRMIDEGHYVGPHSDSHPLYCPWHDRQKNLVTRQFFRDDLNRNLEAIREFGALKAGAPLLFVPPFEWYNASQVRWSRQLDVHLINFTPGSGSNRDYAPEGNARFVASRTILTEILAHEQQAAHGLNGYLLLLHLGSGRRDPFHPLVGELCDTLAARGYSLERVDRLLGGLAKAN